VQNAWVARRSLDADPMQSTHCFPSSVVDASKCSKVVLAFQGLGLGAHELKVKGVPHSPSDATYQGIFNLRGKDPVVVDLVEGIDTGIEVQRDEGRVCDADVPG